MSGDVLVRALVACYPAGWRRRYGDEYAQLLHDLCIQRRPALILDSFCGAVRAHGGVLMSSSPPITMMIWATGLFTVAGSGFAKLAEDSSGRAEGMYGLVVVAAAVTGLAVLAAAGPTAIALLRDRDARAWRYVAVPVVGAAVWSGVVRLALVISAGHGVHSVPNVTGFALIAGTGIAVVAATAWAAAAVLRRVPADAPARLRPVAMMTVAGGMAVATVAALIWGLQLRSGDATGWSGNQGLLATAFAPSWIVIVVALAAATGLATQAGRRQLATVP